MKRYSFITSSFLLAAACFVIALVAVIANLTGHFPELNFVNWTFVPSEYPSFIHDEAGQFTPSGRFDLGSQLAAFQKESGVRIIIYTISSLPKRNGQLVTEHQYADELSKSLDVGEFGRQTGIVMLHVQTQKRFAMSLSKSLDTALPIEFLMDLFPKRVYKVFKKGLWKKPPNPYVYEGFKLAVRELINKIRNEHKPGARATRLFSIFGWITRIG